ncbi:hypothetical protein B0H17DRAFT_640933 [Mycena rosella]|uniref:F-box domain-containing protein n=1 Tax=Mycena rosella TaxID=1033263 RepID=A0AAD7DGY5_MYCRO|nr:hypothetical protein B0H17DRAFT_640933 [Mycena rosella]
MDRMAPSASPMAVQELVDYCIDFLFASPPDLKACALVSRSWTRTSQMHLFTHIVIGSSGYSYGQTTFLALSRTRCTRLFAVLAASPRLLSCIESLQIHLDTVPHDILVAISVFPFVRLQRITVSGNWVARAAIGAVRDLLSLETLTAISISGNFGSLWEFVQVLECCSPNIRDLAFCSVRIAPFNLLTYSDPSDRRRIEIDCLDIWWSDGIHDWLNSPQCPFDFTHLKQLRLNENTSLPQWLAFAPSVPGVEHLQFQAQIPGPSLIDLTPFTNLKSIEVFVEYRVDVSSAL